MVPGSHMMILGKKFFFESAHSLPFHKGKCRKLHGHSYELEVEVIGPINEEGFVMDFADFKKLVMDNIVDQLDHFHLNERWENPTAEVMVGDIVTILKKVFIPHPVEVHQVVLWETKNNYIKWRRTNED